MPVSKLLATLIERLLLLTTEGRIEWQETADENSFQANVPQYVVTISRTAGEFAVPNWVYEIRVADREGTLVDAASDSDFDGGTKIGSYPPDRALNHLFEGARRKALNVDRALSELISSLDSFGCSK